MSIWKYYTNIIYLNCSGKGVKDLTYWRNQLFAISLIYLLPLCLIALLPGVYISLWTGKYMLACIDMLTVVALATAGFMPNINLISRKVIFIACLYCLSCALLFYLGLHGPGLLYLLATCLLSILIFPTTYSYHPALINTFACLAFLIGICFHLIPWFRQLSHPAIEWLVVSSNLVFLSILLAALVPRIFDGLQETIQNEKILAQELNVQHWELQATMSALEQKNAELEQFTYVASHDLKEPLRMITSFMELLKNKYGNQLDQKAVVYIDFALEGGSRMQKMITDLLELALTGRHDAEKELTDFTLLVEDATKNLFTLIEENNAIIVVGSPLPLLTIYRTEITSVVQNLLTNAIKFRNKDTLPLIEINATEKESEWLFSIRDNGIGIEKIKHERIFEIFARIHTETKYEGTGIGLAICKKIIERHGGKIWVESEEGKGSTFHFELRK